MKTVITDGHVNLIKACADSPEMTQWVDSLSSLSSPERNTAVARMLVKMRVDRVDPLMVSAISDLRGLPFLEQFQTTLKEYKKAPNAPAGDGIFKNPLTWVFCCELIYFTAVRILVFSYTGSLISMELYWTALRVVSIIALLILFKPVIWRQGEQSQFPYILVPVCLALVALPFLQPHTIFTSPESYVLAATSLVVGIREEMTYRGVLQRLLNEKFGFLAALVISNIVFVLYHFGVQPFTPWSILMIFLYGTTFGMIYKLTGSIALVALLHAGVDALLATLPYNPSHAAQWLGLLLFASIILILSQRCWKCVRQ